MNPVKHKIFVSTFLLILFYFPRDLDAFINTCYGRNCDNANRDNFRQFEKLPSERENRMVNVRDRVGTERLVNNRRIVDSDSRISENLESRNFDFPRLVDNTRRGKVCDTRQENTRRNFRTEERNRFAGQRVEHRNILFTRESRTNIDNRVERDTRVQNRAVPLQTRVIRENRRERVEANSRRENTDRQINDRNIRTTRQDIISRQIRDRSAVSRLVREEPIFGARVEGRNVRVLQREIRDVDRLIQNRRDAGVKSRDVRARVDNRLTRVEERTARAVSRDVQDDRYIRNNQDMRVKIRAVESRDARTRITNRINKEEDRTTTRVLKREDRDDNRHMRNNRDTRVKNRIVENRNEQVENRVSPSVRTTDSTRRERTSRILHLRDSSRASEIRLNSRTSISDLSRRDIRQVQRTNERIRFMSREVPETSRRFARRTVDVNNNRLFTQRNDQDDRRERTFSNRDSRVREVEYKKNNDAYQWSNVLTTTFAVLLLAQIIASSNSKKFGIPHMSQFLCTVKEKVY